MPRYIDADEFVKRVIQYPRQSTKTIGLALADTPTADVQEVKHGEWIVCVNSEHWKCNQCGCRAGFWFNEENSSGGEMDMSEWLSGFCPNCGADMRKETEGE